MIKLKKIGFRENSFFMKCTLLQNEVKICQKSLKSALNFLNQVVAQREKLLKHSDKLCNFHKYFLNDMQNLKFLFELLFIIFSRCLSLDFTFCYFLLHGIVMSHTLCWNLLLLFVKPTCATQLFSKKIWLNDNYFISIRMRPVKICIAMLQKQKWLNFVTS